MKRVLVLDANQRSALAVTRSLGKQGIEVFTAEETTTALAGCSRFSKQYFTYPSPKQNTNQFIKTLINLVTTQHIDILLPMTELTTMLLLMHQSSFSSTRIPFPSMSTVESLANKCLLMQQAELLDIPIPHTWYENNPDDLSCSLEDLPYPIVLKPGKSWLLHEGLWNRAAVRFADNPTDARNILDSDWAFRAHPFMIQECVTGHGAGIFALYDHGEPLVFFAHNRLREKPPDGGVSVLSESTSINPVLRSHARCLLDQANWHGIAMVEFKVAPDGTPYLMEINTRFWGSLQLAIDAGVDFPWLLYQLACGNQPDSVENYKIGVRLRWLLGDLDNLYLTLRDGQHSFTAKLNAIRQFLTPSLFKTRHEVNRWSDPAPAWFEIKQYLRDLLK